MSGPHSLIFFLVAKEKKVYPKASKSEGKWAENTKSLW